MIGKTGTTQTAQDAWFIGAIPQQSLAVALFTNSQNSISGPGQQTLDMLPGLPGNTTGGYGGAWPAYIWHSFMTTRLRRLPAQAFGDAGLQRLQHVEPGHRRRPPMPQAKKHKRTRAAASRRSTRTLDGFTQPCLDGTAGPCVHRRNRHPARRRSRRRATHAAAVGQAQPLGLARRSGR